MIPYFEPPTLTVLGLTLHAFSVTTAVAVVTGVSLVIRHAPRHGNDKQRAKNLVLWTVVWGFVGAHLASALLYFPDQVRDNPLELLRLWGSLSSFGGMAGGMLGAWVIMRRQAWPGHQQLAFLDLIAWAFPFAWLFGRLGCFLVHDHIGVPSEHWLAVDFPTGPRWDLGLLELVATVPIAVLFAWLGRCKHRNGLYLGLFFALYCPVRFGLDSLRVTDLRYAGLTPGQWACALAFTASLALLVRLYQTRHQPPRRTTDR